ncbi:YesL family protein [Neobacillus cucumis]|uniref:YesL family protein n=1 Tax=Neobacillus cucumis TaxID=1740721 RepID=UPI0035A2EF99
MRFIDGKFYSILLFISNFFLLNLLWLVMCLPIITIFPATSAMYGVMRQWIIHKDPSIFRPFFHYFKENFKQSILIEIFWVMIVFFLYVDYTLAQKLTFAQNIILPILFVLGFLLILVTAFLFPTMVQYKFTTKNLLKNTLVLGICYFPISLGICLLTLLSALILYIFPFSILFIFSIGSYCTYFLCHIAFKKVNLAKGTETQNLIH